MNGVHDMGGMDGFGAVEVEADEPVFHHAWERRVFGLVAALAAGRRLWTTDAFRFAIERMEPSHYLAASYYERWLTAVATLLVEHGSLRHEDLETRVNGPFPLSRAAPLREIQEPAPAAGARFAVGSSVRVGNDHPRGHTRCPRYVRGKRGTVVRVDGIFPLPQVAAHRERRCAETSYGVRFPARELWGDAADANEAIHVDLWESYLEPA
jgi:nitrile hydratase subunit beta